MNQTTSNQPNNIQPTKQYPTNQTTSNQPNNIQPTKQHPTNQTTNSTKHSYSELVIKN
jgi:hypothetical protein